MQSSDVVGGNVAKIAALFPQCVTERKNTEGKVELAIDFEKLKAELSDDVIEGGEERYQFTWPDKRAAARLANTPTTMTLRPCPGQSVGRDGTSGGFDSQNLYIEGENLDVLKVLRETYLGKVKMIYIDPPYNTGNDFVYNDDFGQKRTEFETHSGLFDEDGNLTRDPMVRNTEANGRFHTDWLNMIYPRLKVARDFLADDGVIFISMDDNEAKNLKAVCDEIFGEANFLAQVVWERAFSPINLMKHFSPSHDYILVYAKDAEHAECRGITRSEEADNRYSNPDNDPRGPWMSSDISVGPAIEANIYPITTPSGRIVEPPAARSWSLSRNAFLERSADNRIWFGPDGDGVPRIKRFRSELRKEGITPMTVWKYTEVGHSQDATKALAKLFDGKKYFDYPKPVGLLKRCLSLYAPQECLVMDFFSGSGTFAQAVMELNAKDGGHRKYILVQAAEKMQNPANVSLTFETIPQFAEERIRRAGQNIISEIRKNEEPYINRDANLFDPEDSSLFHTRKSDLPDIGFRVLKLDTSNMEDVYYTPDKFDPSLLDGLEDNIKADRTSEDLLFQVMLDLGIELSAKIERKQIAGKEVFSVDDDYLLACFDTDVNETTIEEMAKLLPTHLVIRDASAANDNVLDNFDQIIETYSAEKKITTHVV